MRGDLAVDLAKLVDRECTVADVEEIENYLTGFFGAWPPDLDLPSANARVKLRIEANNRTEERTTEMCSSLRTDHF